MFEQLLKRIYSKRQNDTGFLSLERIEQIVSELAFNINAPNILLPTYGYSRDFAHPHIEVNSYGYNFVIVERGLEFKRNTTHNIDELLYWIFEGITFSIALEYEVNNRVENQDFRWLLFQKQDELLSILNPSWGQKSIARHSFLLRGYPS